MNSDFPVAYTVHSRRSQPVPLLSYFTSIELLGSTTDYFLELFLLRLRNLWRRLIGQPDPPIVVDCIIGYKRKWEGLIDPESLTGGLASPADTAVGLDGFCENDQLGLLVSTPTNNRLNESGPTGLNFPRSFTSFRYSHSAFYKEIYYCNLPSINALNDSH